MIGREPSYPRPDYARARRGRAQSLVPREHLQGQKRGARGGGDIIPEQSTTGDRWRSAHGSVAICVT